jgi:hypothetical protein
MNKFLLLTLILTISATLFAENNRKGSLCKNRNITDSEKRSFTKPNIFSFDVDGDGKSDTITQRTYKMKVLGKPNSEVKETHWITFDLKTSQGKALKSFFKYKYGDNLADYWVYTLVPCKISQGGKNDLIFYTGDDTSDETVILQNTGDSFKVYSRKTSEF